MSDPLAGLEKEREEVLKEISRIGDMRKGSITETYRCCGKPTCACQASDHAGHGPYFAFTTKVDGKTMTVQLRAGSRLGKFQREVDTYRQFRALSDKLIEVNGSICEARPEPTDVEEEKALKKTSRKSSRKRPRAR
ncbi:MAG: DUF6788 family protein [Vicinamibacteria bacterium]